MTEHRDVFNTNRQTEKWKDNKWIKQKHKQANEQK